MSFVRWFCPLATLGFVLLFDQSTPAGAVNVTGCPGGTFFSGQPLLPGDPNAFSVTVGTKTASIGTACLEASLRRVIRRNGTTRIRAIWETCTGIAGPVRLIADIAPDCVSLTGVIRNNRVSLKSRVAANAAAEGHLGGVLSRRIVIQLPGRVRRDAREHRSDFEQAGAVLSATGDELIVEHLPAAGWILTLGGQRVQTDIDGTFNFSVEPSGPTLGNIYHPSNPDESVGQFSVAELSRVGSGSPAPIVVTIKKSDLCGMDTGPGSPDTDPHCPSNAAAGRALPSAHVHSTNAHDLHADPPLAMTPSSPRQEVPTDVCLDYNGVVGGSREDRGSLKHMLVFLGSTCYAQVVRGCCDGERAAIWREGIGEINPAEGPAGCEVNHKGRFCQFVTQGALGIVTPGGVAAPEGEAVTVEVTPGQQVSMSVFNNGCTGITQLRRTSTQLGGRLFPEAESLRHFERAETRSGFVYLNELALFYLPPDSCTPPAQREDVVDFETDAHVARVSFVQAACCGDATTDQGEQCDDGNQADGDGCDRECNEEQRCGNGAIDPGEACDTSAASESCPQCRSDCTCAPFCGDNICNGSEDPCTCRADCGAGCGPHGESWGDPHLITFDRLAYDFQAVGEFVLTRSLDDSFAVQARYAPFGSSRRVSGTNAVAMRVGTDRVAVYATKDPALYLNGVATILSSPVTLPGGGTVEVTAAGYVVSWPDGSVVRVSDRGSYLNVSVVHASVRVGRVEGLLGNSDSSRTNDLLTSDGVAAPPGPLTREWLYDEYGDSWRVSQADSLFDYGDGETTETFTDRAFPAAFVTINDLDAAARERARAICLAAGITDPILLQACILDVGLTGDPSFSEFPAAVAPPAEATVVSATVIPFRASGYRYKIVEPGAETGFESPTFDDSGFSDGTANFGGGGCTDEPVTPWPLLTDMLVRKIVEFPAGATNLELTVVVDDSAHVFFNGNDLGKVVNGGCARAFHYAIPDNLIVPGPNLLAVRGNDIGTIDFLDMQLTASVPQ